MYDAADAVLEDHEGGVALRFERELPHPPERVWKALTERAELSAWHPTPFELEPRPGGTFHVDFQNDKDIVDGRFVEVIPSRRVVFTWGWRDNPVVPPGSSTVEIDLEPDGQGTRLRLVHRGLPEGALASHTEGWDYFMPRLTDVAEGRPAREAPATQ